MHCRRCSLAVAVLNGLLYVAGGYDNGALSSMECYNPRTNQWTFLASMTNPRFNHSMTVQNDLLYAFGGTNGCSLNVKDSIERYDPATDSWTLVCSLQILRSSTNIN